MTPAARFARILRNPSLYPGVAQALGPRFAWHTHAASPRSSQALCLSAWAPLAAAEARHAVIDGLLPASLPALAAEPLSARGAASPRGGSLPASPPRDGSSGAVPGRAAGRHWRVALEVSDPDVLGEKGGHPGAVDVVLEAADAVVCVESKFLRDAAAGLGGCRQFPQSCRGFYGPGSDRAGRTQAACRLAVRDGRREARRYWDVARGVFRPHALAPGQGAPGSCPLHRYGQLARTLLFATEAARRSGRREFAALVIAPAATAGLLQRQTAAFAGEVLLPQHAGRVAVAHYEDLARLLDTCGDARLAAVGAFVAALLPVAGPADGAASGPTGATGASGRRETARESRRRAEAARRARRRETARSDDAGGSS
jgi:hypothetical protein